MTAAAEAERYRILERTNEGRIEAKLKGIIFGRKHFVDRDRVVNLKASGAGASAIASRMEISGAGVYKILKEKRISL